MPLPDFGIGSCLISGPSLSDPNFHRTVILLCDQGEHGALGLVLNRPLNAPLHQVFPNLFSEPDDLRTGAAASKIFAGGPVEQNRMLALRKGPPVDPATEAIVQGVQLEADVEVALDSLAAGEVPLDTFRFYLGYAGWGAGQLEEELEQGSWIVRPATARLVFGTTPGDLWATALRELGGHYRLLAEIPADPSLN